MVLVPREPTPEMAEAAVYAAVYKAKGAPWFPLVWDAALTASPVAAQAVTDGYYLASFKHQANGSVMWWMPNNAGYTPDLEQAGVYTELTPGYHDSEHTVPVPVSFINGLRVRRVVDPGDSLNSALWSAKSLRAILAALAHPNAAPCDAQGAE
jgi:hypothetical protein